MTSQSSRRRTEVGRTLKVRRAGTDPSSQLLTRHQLGEALQVSLSTIDRAVREGRLEATRVGRSVRFTRAAIDRWVREGGR